MGVVGRGGGSPVLGLRAKHCQQMRHGGLHVPARVAVVVAVATEDEAAVAAVMGGVCSVLVREEARRAARRGAVARHHGHERECGAADGSVPVTGG